MQPKILSLPIPFQTIFISAVAGVLATLILPAAVLSVTYYVSTSGNDSNPGTQTASFKTIQKAVDVAQAGDTVRVSSGTYYEKIVLPRSGTSSNPIVFEGTRGKNGEWLTIIDGSDPIPANAWVSIGSGIWKTTALAYSPAAMVEGDKQIWRIAKSNMDGQATPTGQQILAYPADRMNNGVPYWDGIEALFGVNSGGVTYIRYRNGDNPNLKNLRTSPGQLNRSSGPFGAGVTIDGKSYNTIRDFEIRGAQNAVLIKGTTALPANFNRVENNRLLNGRTRIYLFGQVASTVIQGNRMEMKAIGTEAYGSGVWTYNSTAPHDRKVNNNLYGENKFLMGESDEDDRSIYMWSGGAGTVTDTQIADNILIEGGVGIFMNGAYKRTKIYGNIIAKNFSQNIYITPTGNDVEIYDNLIYSGGRYGIRYNAIDRTGGPYYIYRNRFWGVTDGATGNGVDQHISFQAIGKSPLPPGAVTVWIYHNSFSGGGTVAHFNTSMPKVRMINNIFSTYTLFSSGTQGSIYEYNWSYTKPGNTAPRGTNIGETTKMWPDTTLPDFFLPSTSTAHNSGLNLSQSFTLKGVTYPALPGMTSAYYGDGLADMGAIQSEGS
jgi:hypothetical protein